MKNKKGFSLLALSTILAGLAVTITNADLELTTDTASTEIEKELKKGRNGVIKGLSDEEKQALESMSDEEKQEFFNSKREERKAEKEAKKIQKEAYASVINKLLAGEELTQEEEELREEIIEKRSERKVKE